MSRLELSDVELSDLAALKAIAISRRRSSRRSAKSRAADAAVLGLVAAVGGQSIAAASDELDQELIDSLAGLKVVDDLTALAADCDPAEQFADVEHLQHNGQLLASYMRHDAPYYLNDPFASRFASRFAAEHDGHEGAAPGDRDAGAHSGHSGEEQHAAAAHHGGHEGGAHDGHESAGESHGGHEELAASHENHEDEGGHEAHSPSANHGDSGGHAGAHTGRRGQSPDHGASGHESAVSAEKPAAVASSGADDQHSGGYHTGSGASHAGNGSTTDALAGLDIEDDPPAAAPAPVASAGHDHGPTMADMDLPPAEDLAAATHHHVV